MSREQLRAWKHTDCKWILLYIERWLKAPVELPDGTILARTKGTPQGGVISPLLANIFLHHAFDKWMEEKYPYIKFERYADDIIVHCGTEKQAKYILKAIETRMELCRLELHPEKTKIVYCKDNERDGDPEVTFDFLSYTFRPRISMNRQGFTFITPAVSRNALKSMGDEIRRWNLGRRSDISLEYMAQWVNPIVRGWINYYGKYRPSALFPIFRQLVNVQLTWAKRKYKKLRSYRKAREWLLGIALREKNLFTHWQWYYRMGGGITRAV